MPTFPPAATTEAPNRPRPVPLGRPPDDGGAHKPPKPLATMLGASPITHGPHGHIAYPTGREPE